MDRFKLSSELERVCTETVVFAITTWSAEFDAPISLRDLISEGLEDGPMTTEEIAEWTGVNRDTVRKTLYRMSKRKSVIRGSRQNGFRWSLRRIGCG